MSGYPIMRSLDPYHQRIGYLGALAVVAYRGLDTRESVLSRLESLLFRKVRTDETDFASLMASASPQRQKALEAIRSGRSEEDNPAAILRPADEASDWVYISEAWLHQDCVPSHLGFVQSKKIDRILDLGKWTGILTNSYELSESGFILQNALKSARDRSNAGELFNVLAPRSSAALPIIYLRLLMDAEVLWPSLVCEMVEREDSGRILASRGEEGLLKAAVDRLLSGLGDKVDLLDLADLRNVHEFRDAIAGKPSTAENYLRPRMEILVDLDLVGRRPAERGRNFFAWTPTDRTRRLAHEWADLTVAGNHVEKYLETSFFGSMNRVLEIGAKPARDTRAVLLWFARAFAEVGRDFGFTPGRTVAEQACLMAWSSGTVLEISDVFDAVYAAARSEWSHHFRFSGGSRMDREFMIRVEPALVRDLEESQISSPGET